jgi:D-arabinose 5-phosphate isomerase GutQ
LKKEALDRARESFQTEAKAIIKTLENMDFQAFGKAVDILSKCGRIATIGCGHSGIACRHFAHSLCCIELPARFISPSEAVHGAMGFVQEGDAVVLASRGGKTAELIPVLNICRVKKATIIGITENMESQLALLPCSSFFRTFWQLLNPSFLIQSLVLWLHLLSLHNIQDH